MKKIITIMLSISTIFLGGLCVFSRMSGDRVKPNITVPSGEMTYYAGQSDSQLLIGATAYDDVDGDITSNIRIYDIAVISEKNSALITYAVYDNSFNLGKATKVVRYVNDGSKNGETPLEEAAESDHTAATTEKKTETVTEKATETVTENAAVESVTEAAGAEATTEKAATESEASAGSPKVILSQSEVTIVAGGSFSAMDYVEDVTDDKDTRTELFRNVRMTGDYSTKTPGVYKLSYYCTDSDGNKSNVVVLTLTVQ